MSDVELFLKIMIIITAVFFLVIFPILFIVLKKRFLKRTAQEVRRENMSKIDFARDVNFYRDILKECSIAALSYIDDFQLDVKREIVVTLLSLRLKKKIEITENGISVLESNFLGLKRSEIFVLNNIIDGKVRIENEKEFLNEVQIEAVGLGMIEKVSEETVKTRLNANRNKRINKEIIFLVILAFLNYILSKFVFVDDPDNVSFLIFSIFVFGSIRILGLTEVPYVEMQLNSYKRTPKGEEINEKLEGLKQYIKDYSMLSQAEKETLEIWEEYLLYSIIFDMNRTEIVEEISKLIEFV